MSFDLNNETLDNNQAEPAGAPAADPSHETVCRICDCSVGRAAFEPSTEAYIAVFHIARVRPGAPAASSNSAK